jgi:PAS domain S-box-containing protein
MRVLPTQHLKDLLLPILGLAIVYAVVGRLSLLLAIPPGYSMAVYPPAGIALGMVLTGGYRLLPGVALGSFLVNLFVSFENFGQINNAAILLSTLLALGASLQAGVSAYLIKRLTRSELILDNQKIILRFFLYGGLIGCLISASVGIFSLYTLGILPASAIISNWLTWWMGDTFGVLTITPIVLILFARPKKIWQSRRWNVMLPLVVCLTLVVTAFVFIRDREQEKQQFEFRLEAEHISETLQTKFNNHTDAVRNIERLFASSDAVSRKDFDIFVAHTIQNHPEIGGLLWVPRITRAEKPAFESTVISEGFPDFHLTERDSEGKLTRAGQRDDYYPANYFAPFDINSPAFGFDMGSDAVRRTAIEDAGESGQITATDPLVAVMKKPGQSAVFLYAPVYARGKLHNTMQQRKDALIGVAVSALLMNDIIESLQTKDQQKSILLKFYDLSYPSGRGIFFNRIDKKDPLYHFETIITFGGKQYALMAAPSDLYWKKHTSWITWITMVGGLLFTGLLGIYLLMSTAHTFNVEALVLQRTAELYDREERLKAILANAAEGILTTNQTGQIESANPSTEEMLEYPAGDLVGRSIFSLFPDTTAQEFLHKTMHSGLEYSNSSNLATTEGRRQVNGKNRTVRRYRLNWRSPELHSERRHYSLQCCTI